MRILISKYLLGLTFISVFSGCSKDFLQKNPQGDLTQASFPTSQADALLATNAAYATLRDWNYNSGGYPILDIMSDDAYKGSNTNDQLSTVGPYDNFTINSTQDGLDRWWASLYQGIKRANVVIEKVPLITMDTVLRTRYLAEARFLRGLYYFDLVRAWGDVPKVTDLNPPVKLARSPKEEIYTLIKNDLLYAIQYLTEKAYSLQQMPEEQQKEAAQTMLGKVYLFQQDYTNAEKYLLAVISSNAYGLEAVYTDANGVNGNNGIESVFEVGAIAAESFDGGGAQYGNVQGVRGAPNKGWGFNRPSVELRKSFEPGDPRLKGTIIDLGDVLDNVTISGEIIPADPAVIKNANGDTINIQCYNRKVWTPGNTTVTQWAWHRRLIRYADVLLMTAEVLNENGNTSQALIYLNMVRARARQGNAAILADITVTDKSALRDKIFTERRHELAMEGIRFWDLVRSGNAPTILGPLGFVQGKNELLPIHQTEIDISQGTLTQNPNYK